MKNVCEDLKVHATKIIKIEKKREMIPLTVKESKSYLLYMQKEMFC